MNILQYSYKKKGKIEFVFEDWPHSKVTMAPIQGYYFVRCIKWSSQDPIVTRTDLEKMEWAANQYVGTAPFYRKRKAFETPSSPK
ncbi:hypothetical protein P9B58_19405 [Bacillus mojavensis]|jgi:hypothetical protein|uniref:YuzH n=2 Tax=Bacillus mojavensis TaxID=72360 RepID=A0ABX6LZY9_BACMO|nr:MULTISPECIES: hypothetical protein [Bacillus]MCC2930510.1 hypothetical protein [Bacillus sp. LBG-1-113]MCY8104875.1 hypothetical protein [Bacillus mojavensis]MCY8483422.1 hypothetical protein [Bacillus mojavensis]MCY9090524.1 hypothetical protein [Bacillus mojavensis]MCY9188501.1 hypothetical protein [Bacillus mojavensis]